LHPQQYFSVAPQLLKVIILAHIGREKMHNHIPIIENKPAFLRLALYTSLFLIIVIGGLQHTFG
jgi:hypothetical protein